jgi:hypothetical protein
MFMSTLKSYIVLAASVALSTPAAAFDVPDPGEPVCVTCSDSDRDYEPRPYHPPPQKPDYNSPEWRAHFLNDDGIKLYRDGNYREAVAKFHAAYNLNQSSLPIQQNLLQAQALLAIADNDDYESYARAFQLLNRCIAIVNQRNQAEKQSALDSLRRAIKPVVQKYRERLRKRQDWVINQEHIYHTRLEALRTNSVNATREFNEWAKEAQREHDKVIREAASQAVTLVAGEAADRLLDKVVNEKLISKVVDKALDVKDVRSGALKGAVRSLVDDLREEIRTAVKGQSAAEAKETARELLLTRINANADAMVAAGSVAAERALDYLKTRVTEKTQQTSQTEGHREPLVTWATEPAFDAHPLPRVTLEQIQRDAEKAYPYFLDLIKLARAHGNEALVAFEKKIPVLMLLPDGVEWAATFCRLALDKRGIQALDQMQATTLQYINWYSHGDSARHIPGLPDLIKEERANNRDFVNLDKWAKL